MKLYMVERTVSMRDLAGLVLTEECIDWMNKEAGHLLEKAKRYAEGTSNYAYFSRKAKELAAKAVSLKEYLDARFSHS
jgi:hypothetical protein